MTPHSAERMCSSKVAVFGEVPMNMPLLELQKSSSAKHAEHSAPPFLPAGVSRQVLHLHAFGMANAKSLVNSRNSLHPRGLHQLLPLAPTIPKVSADSASYSMDLEMQKMVMKIPKAVLAACLARNNHG